MRKKLLTTILTLSLLTPLVGCGSSNTQASNEDNTQSAVETQNNENKVNNEEQAKKPTDTNKKEENNNNKNITKDSSVEKSNATNSSSSNNTSNSKDNIKKINNDKKSESDNTHSNNNSNASNNEKSSKNETTNSHSKESKSSETQASTKNDNLTFQNLAEIIAKKEFQSDNIGNMFAVKGTREGNNLTFEKDASSNVFLNTPEKFSKDPKDGLLILILPDAKKEGDKTYHSFKLSSISMIENGGTGTVDIGRIYNDGTVKFGEF